MLVSFDPNLRFSLWDDKDALYRTVHEFLPYADILKLSDEELEFITGEKDIKNALPSLFAYGCKCIVYTQGKDGATLYRRNDSISAKGHQVHVVDTTGAGDSFIGAFLYCLLKENISDLENVSLELLKHHLEFANLYAAHTTTMAGALAAMLGIDFVIAIGSKAARIADGAAMSGGDVVHFATKEEALPTVREQLRPNTSMLIKASHSMRFERLTEDLRKYYD